MLTDEEAELVRDGRRYRWLKQHSPEIAVPRSEVTQYWAGDDLDAAIDAAMCNSSPPASFPRSL